MYNLMQRWEDESDEFHLIMSFARRANAVKLIAAHIQADEWDIDVEGDVYAQKRATARRYKIVENNNE